MRSNFSLASGVRKALWADSVTLGSLVSSCPAGSGSVVNTSSAAWRATGFPISADRVAVAGSLIYNEAAHGWVAMWHMNWQGRGYDWGVGGVSFDEAFRVAARGAMAVLSGHGAPRG